MDTLLIVRKIREAEELADSGKHGEARRLLEPLLSDDALTDTHRKLVTKKLDLFKKQHERMTRIISRRATSSSTRDPADESSARTAIRKAVDDKERSDRPTDLTIEKDARGAPTEVVPRARDVDTEVPERGHKLRVEPRTLATPPPMPSRPVARPAGDSQELAPVAEPAGLDGDDTQGDDPRKSGMFSSPLGSVQDDDDGAPTISRSDLDRPVYPTGNDTPAPGWRDTPVPQAAVTAKPADRPTAKVKVVDRTPPPVVVKDSIVTLGADTVMSPALPEKHDDSTFLMADDYFTTRASARNRERSNPELKALADRLPDDDLRRELALEVVKLREQLQSAEKDKQTGTRSAARKIVREDRPESGSFHIPASQVNTIVRKAAGTDQIEVHMPSRDEEAQELQVLRRDSVRGQKTNATPTDRIALAQDYIDAGQITRPGLFKPLATWLGVVVILAVIAWAVHLGWQSIQGDGGGKIAITLDEAGAYRIGAARSDYDDIKHLNPESRPGVLNEWGWLIQFDDAGTITGVAIPGPSLRGAAESRFSGVTIDFNGDTYTLGGQVGASELAGRFGGAYPEFSKAVWDASDIYTLRFESRQGERALEFCFRTEGEGELLWMRLIDSKAQPKSPSEADFR